MIHPSAEFARPAVPRWSDTSPFTLSPESEQAVLAPFHARGERVLAVGLAVHSLLAFVFASFGATLMLATQVVPVALGLFLIPLWLRPGSFLTRSLGGVALQVFTALHIHQMPNLPAMHFFFFTSCVLLIACCDWLALWPGTLASFGHHVVCQWLSLVDANILLVPSLSGPWPGIVIHLAVALSFVCICSYWAAALRAQILADERQKRDIAGLALVAERAHNAVFILDAQRRIQWTNDGLTRMTGHTFAEARGHTPDELLRVSRLGDGQADGHGPKELRILTRAGETAWITRTRAAIHDRLGKVKGYIDIITDITPLKRAELERQEFQTRVQNAQRLESLGVLAGGIAHDFNNLLTAILGFTAMARTSLPEDAPAQDFLRQSERAADRAAKLTAQILAYSGRGQFHVQAVQLSALITDLKTLLTAGLPHSLNLQWDLADEVPTLQADHGQLSQVVVNLVTNAAEALGDEPGTVTVRTRVRTASEADLASPYALEPAKPGTYVVLEVADTGPGMDELTQARLFEPFFTTKFLGRGLGLPAVLGIVRSHKGVVQVLTAPGQGATFRVWLPANRSERSSRMRKLPKRLPGPTREVIVIAEPENSVRVYLASMVEDLGYRALTIASLEEFREKFPRVVGSTGLVLLNLAWAVPAQLAVVRQEKPNPAVVLLADSAAAEQTETVHDPNIVGVLVKPFAASDFRDLVRSLMGTPTRTTGPLGLPRP